LAVPAGKIASVAAEPTSASTQRWTVPSPPQTKIRSAPRFSACRVGHPVPGEQIGKLGETAAERLASVRDDGDRGHAPSVPVERSSRNETC
jgi:hypothetical protein